MSTQDLHERSEPAPPAARRRRGRAMPQDEVDRRFPTLKVLAQPNTRASERAWVAVFNTRPDAMHALLADFIKAVHATPGKIGQRPMPREEQVDFETLLYGEFSEEPLTAVLPALMRVSERAFAARIHMSRTQLQRLLAGDYEPDVNELRQIAVAIRKSPTFFLEYRKAMAMAAFVNLLDQRPGIATSLYRTYLQVRMGDS